ILRRSLLTNRIRSANPNEWEMNYSYNQFVKIKEDQTFLQMMECTPLRQCGVDVMIDRALL
ncbi:hypothetical protein Q7C09_05765, partial [Heyndrickxia coagulans]|uniref:hypothetical protein n=1 Tax=Heyndrickxia coagulans TaxID=1398 RepID=UPI002810AE39